MPFGSLGPFANAVSQAEREGAGVSAFAMNPATALMLETMKEVDGSRKALLGQDPTEPGIRRILGVPVVVSPAIAERVVWCYDRTRVVSVVREDVDLAVDESVFFTSHRVAVRAVMRVGFPHTTSVVRITAAAV